MDLVVAIGKKTLDAETYVVTDVAGESFVISGLIYQSAKSFIYRAERISTKTPVIVKLINPAAQTPHSIARIKREYELINTLDIQGIRRCLSISEIDGGIALILEDIGALTLRELIEGNTLTLANTLDIFIDLTTILAAIHTRGVIHKDLNPANILVHPDSGAVYLIDFDIAARLTREQVDFGTVEAIEGTLAYVSPEQTGRTGHPLDERTDLYSLGATIYEALTATSAFSGDTAIDVVYAHLALVPRSPEEINPAIPSILAQLIMKLLAKDPSARYKSALGVKYDLMKIRQRLYGSSLGGAATSSAAALERSSDSPSGFKLRLVDPKVDGENELTLGAHDAPLRLNIPQKIYGRQEQRAQLIDDFEFAEIGRSAVSLIAGPSGSGKTSLIMELASSMLRTRAIFITGKFEELCRDIPYDAVIRALRAYIIGLNSSSNDEIQTFKKAVTDAVAPNCSVLVDAIPELAPILGPQPALGSLNPNEQKNRFQQSFVGLIKALKHDNRPIIIFMDDLQWADFASIDLIGQFILDTTIGHVLLIGAYRDNEVSAAHPLSVALAEWRRSSARISTITLAPMGLAAINELCSDALQLDSAMTQQLAHIVSSKTGGNPFFVHQFLRALYRDKYIDFDIEQGRWVFAIEQIRQAPLTDNIIELLSARIHDLSTQSRTILTFASCLGGAFDLYTLAQAMNKSLFDVAQGLNGAISDDLIVPIGEEYRYIDAYLTMPSAQQSTLAATAKEVKYRFVHDRVREAAYLSLDDSQRLEIRLRVGRILKKEQEQALTDDDLVSALNHLNAAETLIHDPEERLAIASMNLFAGKRAQSASSWNIAAILYKHGITFLPQESWTLVHELTRELHIGAGTCDTLAGKFADAETTFELLLKQSNSNIAIAQIQHLRAILYIAMQDNAHAIAVGILGLGALGIKVGSKDPLIVADLFQILYTRLRVSRYTADEIINMAQSDDPVHEMATKMLIDLCEPCLLVNQKLAIKLVCIEVAYCLKHGITRYSAHAFLQLACVINGGSVAIATKTWYNGEVEKLCRIWRALAARFPNEDFNFRQQFVWTLILSHWDDALPSHIRGLTEMVPRFAASGDIAYTLYALCTLVDYSQNLGENLSDLVDRSWQFYDYSQNLRFEGYTNSLRVLYGVVATLSSKDTQEDILAYAESISTHTEKRADLTTYCSNLMMQAELYFIVGDYERALASLVCCQKVQMERVFFGTVKLAWFYTYLMMILGMMFHTISWYKKPYYLYLFIRSLIVAGLYEKMSVKHFRAHHLIGKAMWRKILRLPLSCYSSLLEEAITSAHRSGFSNCEAYAAEILGNELLKRGGRQMAQGPLITARRAYGHWGVRYKMHEMDALINEHTDGLKGESLLSSRYGSAKISANTTASSSNKERITISGSTGSGSINASAIDKSEAFSLDTPILIRAAQVLSGEIHLQELKKKMMSLVCENAGARSAYLLMQADDSHKIEDSVSSKHLKVVASAHSNNEVIVELASRDLSVDILSTKAVQYVVRTKSQLIIGDALNDIGWCDDESFKARKVKSVLCLPIIAGGSMRGILYMENELIPYTFTQERIQLLSMLSGQMAISLENATLYAKLEAAWHAEREARVQERTAHEDYVKAEGERQILSANIEAARAVQESLLFVTKDIPNIKLAQFYRPAERAGGDWYGCYFDTKQQRLYLFLGDVTGHGVSSALVTAAAAGAAACAIRQIIEAPQPLDTSLRHVGFAMHEAVRSTGMPAGRMMTMTMVGIDVHTGIGYYINAGHRPIVHLSTGYHEILAPGTPLGVSADASFGESAFRLSPGDQLFLYSDGLIENLNTNAVALSRRKLRGILQELKDPDEIVARLTLIVDDFVVGPKTDDTAFIALCWSKRSE